MTDIYKWSLTADENDDADSGITWAEFQDPDTVNNSARTMMARVAALRNDLLPDVASTGSGNAYVVTADAAPAAFDSDFVVYFRADKTNSAACTLKVNALGTKPLRAKSGAALTGGEIQAGTIVGAYYVAATDEFLIINSGHHVNVLGATIASAYVTGLKVGDVMLTMDATPRAGRLRLGEGWTNHLISSYPELYAWRVAQASSPAFAAAPTAPVGYFNLPPAAGYFPRFAATSSAIDPDGPRGAATIQTASIESHAHGPGTLGGTTGSGTNHKHSIPTLDLKSLFAGGGTNAYTTGSDKDTGNEGAHTHTFSVTTGATAAFGGSETRPKNIALHADMLASAAEANADIYGVGGLYYAYDSDVTAGDPGAGHLRFNAALASATQMYISETDGHGADLAGMLSGLTAGSTLYAYKVGAPGTFFSFVLSTTTTDNGAYHSATVAYLDHAGTLADEDVLAVVVMRAGEAGPAGAGMVWRDAWLTATAYDEADTVSNGGSSYICTAAHTSAAGTEPGVGASWATVWDLVTAGGQPGLDWQGAWTTATAYLVNDGVSNDGSSYICTSAHTSGASTEPGVGASWATVWEVLAQKGTDGLGSGTVTSVGVAAPTIFSVSGSPVTSSGTITITLANQSANTIFAGPAAGGAATPTFRSLAAADLPASTTSAIGALETATTAEAATGTDTSRAVVPSGLFPAEADIASAATCAIGGAASLHVRITGTTTITSFGTANAGIRRKGRFAGSLILTHNATSLILPGGLSITTAANDRFEALSLGSGNWIVLWYAKADGTAVVGSGSGAPVGSEMLWPLATPPTGYLEEDGSAISRTTYAALFAVIGTSYGPGDGSTTFNLPDARGEHIRIWDHGAGRDPDAASRTDRGDGTTGDNPGTRQADQIESHTHTVTQAIFNGNHSSPTGGTYARIASATTTGATGGNETRGRNVYRMMIIKY